MQDSRLVLCHLNFVPVCFQIKEWVDLIDFKDGRLDIHIETYISGVDTGFYVFWFGEEGKFCRQRILRSSSSEWTLEDVNS